MFSIFSISKTNAYSTLVSLKLGRATFANGIQFKFFIKSLITQGIKNIVVDCRPLVVCDPKFIDSLIFTKMWTQHIGGDLRLVRARFPELWSMFSEMRLANSIEIYDDIETAVNSFDTVAN